MLTLKALITSENNNKMLKKVLTIAVLSVSALSVMEANAAVPGIYVTGQIGYANTHMKDKADLSELKEISVTLDSYHLSNNGLAGRLALGYQFNQNFAIELGYMQLNKDKKNTRFISSDPLNPFSLTLSASLKQNAIDFVGKGILPISDKINIYGKLGVAYLTTHLNVNLNASDPDKTQTAAVDNSYFNIAKHQWAPEVAIGISYDITPNVAIDTSWTHIQPLGRKRASNIDFAAVGLAYNFG
jgi:OmpA-OmpF porin, OOP family